MPFPALDDTDAVTPYRHTHVELDGPQWAVNSVGWKLDRDANQIQRAPQENALDLPNTATFLLPGAGWILEPVLLRLEGQLTESGAGAMLDGDEFANLAGNVASGYRWRKGTDLQGVSYASGVETPALPEYFKATPAGSDYTQELTADRTAQPSPLDDPRAGSDRVLAGTKTYPENQGFLFSFFAPAAGDSAELLYRFYWGGPSDTQPARAADGYWCLSFLGNGTATLWEQVRGVWKERGAIGWSELIGAKSGWVHTFIAPFRRNRLFFITAQGQGEGGAMPRLAETQIAPRDVPLHMTVHRHSAALTGYAYQSSICGAGEARVDARSDLNFHFSVGATTYPAVGLLIDHTFSLPNIVPAETVMRLVLRKVVPAGSNLTATIYDGDTGDVCQFGPQAGEFLTRAGQRKYIVKFTFSSAGATTAALEGYTVEVDARVSAVLDETAPLISSNNAPAELDLLGQDTDPTHQTGRAIIHDLTDELVRLRQRGRVPTKFLTTIDALGTQSCIFDGEIVSPDDETVYLTDGRTYHRYNCALIGKWGRLREQRVVGSAPFGQLGDRITDIIYALLRAAGVPDSELDIPSNSLTWWPNGNGDGNVLVIQHGTPYLDFAQELARNYLDGWLTHCPNSGTTGLWRLRLNPSAPAGNILYTFVLGPTSGAGRLAHVPGTYGGDATFVRKITTRRQPPEANHIFTFGFVDGLAGSKVRVRASAQKRNKNSFNLDPANPTANDPAHLDYLGFQIMETFYDPSIVSQEHCNFLCGRLYDLIAHGRILKRFDAPLVFVNDPQDVTLQRVPRPLQIGDSILVNNQVCVVRSCNIAYRHDRAQMMNIEAVVV